MEDKNIQVNITDELYAIVNNVLQREIEAEFDSHIKELQEKKNQIIAGILLNVKKTIDIDVAKDRVIFTIREIKQ